MEPKKLSPNQIEDIICTKNNHEKVDYFFIESDIVRLNVEYEVIQTFEEYILSSRFAHYSYGRIHIGEQSYFAELLAYENQDKANDLSYLIITVMDKEFYEIYDITHSYIECETMQKTKKS